MSTTEEVFIYKQDISAESQLCCVEENTFEDVETFAGLKPPFREFRPRTPESSRGNDRVPCMVESANDAYTSGFSSFSSSSSFDKSNSDPVQKVKVPSTVRTAADGCGSSSRQRTTKTRRRSAEGGDVRDDDDNEQPLSTVMEEEEEEVEVHREMEEEEEVDDEEYEKKIDAHESINASTNADDARVSTSPAIERLQRDNLRSLNENRRRSSAAPPKPDRERRKSVRLSQSPDRPRPSASHRRSGEEDRHRSSQNRRRSSMAPTAAQGANQWQQAPAHDQAPHQRQHGGRRSTKEHRRHSKNRHHASVATTVSLTPIEIVLGIQLVDHRFTPVSVMSIGGEGTVIGR